MASVTNGGWYLDGTTLEYRKFKDGSTTELSTTVMAKITGLNKAQVVQGTGNDEGYVLVYDKNSTNDNKWRRLEETDIVVADKKDEESGKITGTITISSLILPCIANKAIEIKDSTGYNYTMKLSDSDKVKIASSETITEESKNTAIRANLSPGYTMATNNKKATYYAARTSQTLATITGLANNYTDSTASLTAIYDSTNTDKVGGAGVVTLSKTSTAGEVSALGTKAIKITMENVAKDNGISYTLALGEGKTGQPATYAQVEDNDEAPYWKVDKTTATYQYYSPTGYTLNSTATQVDVAADKTTTVVTITGLASDLTTNETDTTVATAVGTGYARDSAKTSDNKFVPAITIVDNKDVTDDGGKPSTTTDAEGKTTTTKGEVSINITRGALPTKGIVTVTAGKDFTITTTTETTEDENDFYTDSDKVEKAKIWVVNGTTATYQEVDLAYYTVDDSTKDKNGNTVTKIVCTPQGKATVLATIKGLNEDWLADESNLERNDKDTSGVITHIKGINIASDGSAAVKTGNTVTKAAIPGEIMLSSEVLGNANATLGKSDNFRLSLATSDDIGSDKTVKDETTAVDLPTFNTYKWNLSGTTATLKGTVTEGYTVSDDGRTVNYIAAGENQTLATIKDLKKGTMLERETEGTNESGNKDYRRIGNYIDGYDDDDFVDGLAIVTDNTKTGGKLSHKTIEKTNSPDEDATAYSIKALERMPITLSKHVMDGKVTLTSNFFTLAVNKTIAADATLTDKAASRTYVLEKYADEIYEDITETVNGKTKTTTVVKDGAGAIIDWHGSLGATATLKQSAPACYELVKDEYETVKTINYTKPGTATNLATIKGLNSAITENDIEVSTTADDTDGKFAIKIKNSNALTTGNVTITNASTDTTKQPTQYKLALEIGNDSGISEAELDDEKWTQSGTTVSYTATVTSPGYKLNKDENTITYIKAATNNATTLATITGLRTGLAKVTATQNSGNDGSSQGNEEPELTEEQKQFSGVTFNDTDGTITLSNSALNNANVKLTSTANYKLLIDDDVVDEKPTAADRWVVSGTTATFKKVIPDYYTYNESANTLTYNKPVDVKYTTDKEDPDYNKNKAGKAIVYGTIKGLKSGLVVNKAGDALGYYKEDGTYVEKAIVFGTAAAGEKTPIIIKDAGVLDYKNSVTLDATAIANYTIALDTTETEEGKGDSLADTIKPKLVQVDSDDDGEADIAMTPEWTISKGTATYKGDVQAGYANSGDGTSIVFSAAKEGATIATITGLDKTITTVDDNIELGTGTSADTFTIKAGVLGNSDAVLTTNIALLGSNYKLALGDDVTDAAQADDEQKQIWSINKNTATYGVYKPTYYTLNSDATSDTITYTAAGVAEKDKLATIEGLASGLVTIEGDQIRGISIGTVDNEGAFTADDDQTAATGTVIQLDANVLSESPKTGDVVKLTRNGSTEYTLAITSNVATPQPTVTHTIEQNGNVAKVTLTDRETAGFTLDNDTKTGDATTPTLTYTAAKDKDGMLAIINGLKKDIKLNADGGIDGLIVDEDKKEITLSKSVLTTSNVKNTQENSAYSLKLATGTDDDPPTASSGYGWKATGTKGTYELYSGMATYGYSEENDGSIGYTPGGDNGILAATITGLNNATLTGTALSGVEVDDNGAITIKETALSGKDIVVTGADGNAYSAGITLDNSTDLASEMTSVWSVNNGTATYTQTISEGYEADDDTTTIKYTPKATITSTLSGLSKETLKISEEGKDGNVLYVEGDSTKAAIEFDSTEKVFTVNNEDALAHKKVSLATKITGTVADSSEYAYTLGLADDVAAKAADPIWNKTGVKDTKATLTQTTASGYSLDSNHKNITYSTDPTTVTLATVSGLIAGENYLSDANGELTGLAIKTERNEPVKDNAGNTIITISKNLLTTTKVTLGNNDKYVFELDTAADTAVPTTPKDTQVWTVNKTTATYKNVQTPYYTLGKETENSIDGTKTGKEITYTAQKDGTTEDAEKVNLITIKGLKSGLDINDGNVTGISFDSDNNAVVISATALSTTAVAATFENGTDYTKIALDSDVVKKGTESNNKWKDQIEWVGNGGTYTYKKYDKAYYTLSDDSKSVTYTAEGKNPTVYATITGLASNLIPTGAYDETTANEAIGFDPVTGSETTDGTITLGATQLANVTGTVKLTTNGNFKLALNTDTSEGAGGVTEAKISGETWKTSGTTATLSGTKSIGYTLSEDEKSITYQKAEGTVTVAKVTGLKKNAEIANGDVTGSDANGYVITLSQSQLGTSNVTVTGEGYTLKVADDAASGQEEPNWVKANNATKATFTQKRYNGFRESTDGKSLIYQKATGTVDLATINGLSKTITTDDMATITEEDSNYSKLDVAFGTGRKKVVINTTTKEIYVDSSALSGKVTLGKNDDYTLKLYNKSEDDRGATSVGGDEVKNTVTFNNGTMSIVNGNKEKWEESTDGKSLTYTAASYATLATVSNLPKTLTYDSTAASLQGFTVDGTKITINQNAVIKDGTSLLANKAKITLANKTTDSVYSIENATGNASLPMATISNKWVYDGKKFTLSLKNVTSANYTFSDATKDNKGLQSQTITYAAENVPSANLAQITFKGLTKDFLTQDGDEIKVTSDGKTAFEKPPAGKEITIKKDLLTAIEGASLAATIDLTSTDYTFATTNFSGVGSVSSANTGNPEIKEASFNTAGKATLLKVTSAGWTFDSTTKKKVEHTKESSAAAGTVNGINKEFGYDDYTNIGALKLGSGADSLNITVGAAALTNSNVTFSTVKGGNSYKLHLADTVNSKDNTNTASKWKNQTEWVTSGGAATYKFYDKENWYLDSAKNQIVYVKPTAVSTFAQISGMNKTASIATNAGVGGDGVISLGAAELGTSKVTLKITTAKAVNATVADATTINASITAGNNTAAKFKLALATTGDNSVSASTIKQAVWDNNGTTANLTGTISKGYRLSNDQKTITYQANDSRLQVIAKVTGIKSGSQISDSIVAPLTSGADYNKDLPNLQYITLKNEHLGTSNVQLTGEGYRLSLDGATANSVIGANGDADSIFWHDQTEWVANNGTFTYKTYDKAHYTLESNGMKVTYTAAKDDTKNNTNHKTYLTITGLSKTAEASDLEAAGNATNNSGTINVTTANSGVISLGADVLNKAAVKLTDNQNGGYSLVLGDDVTKSTVDQTGVSVAISGTKATWTGTQGKGYFLANDGQNVTYYSADKKKHTIATVTGLKSSVTSANSKDAFADLYSGGADNVVSLGAANVSDKVTVGGTAAFYFEEDYTKGNIIGSTAADKVTFAAGGNSINAAGGNDVIDFANTKNNVFFYANNQGNDVIKGFDASTDIIKVTNVVGTTSKTTTKTVDGKKETETTSTNNISVYQDTKITDDAIVKVNNNYIRLKGMGNSASNITVYDKDGKVWDSTYVTNNLTGSFKDATTANSGSNVLADDNYAMTPQNTSADSDYAMSPNLSSIVKSSTASYTTDDLVADDATALTKQSTAVSYSDKK